MRHILLFFLCFPVILQAQNMADTGLLSHHTSDASEVMEQENPSDRAGFWIAPNPSEDFMDIYTSGISGEVTIHVFTLVGKKLCSFKPQVLNGDLLLHTDVSSWLPGTYLVRLEQNSTVLKTMRFIRR